MRMHELCVLFLLMFVVDSVAQCTLKEDSLLTTQWHKDMLTAHNAARLAVNPPAANMECMLWDDNLVPDAQAQADLCQFAASPTKFNAFGYDRIGESLAAGTLGSGFDPNFAGSNEAAARNVAQHWADKGANYVFADQSCSEASCREYLQMVWHDSYGLGCAFQRCSENTPFNGPFNGPGWILWSCKYGEAGNRLNERPYTQGAVTNFAVPSRSQCGSCAPTCAAPAAVSNGVHACTANFPVPDSTTCPSSPPQPACFHSPFSSVHSPFLRRKLFENCPELPPIVVNGQPSTNCARPTLDGNSCDLNCNPGFIPSASYLCSQGQWSAPVCGLPPAVSCSAQPPTVSGAPAPSCTLPAASGSACVMRCDNGVSFSSTCDDGHWITPALAAANPCVVTCTTVPPIVPNSVAAPCSIPALSASTCPLTCVTRFQKSGDFRCNDGVWSLPSCTSGFGTFSSDDDTWIWLAVCIPVAFCVAAVCTGLALLCFRKKKPVKEEPPKPAAVQCELVELAPEPSQVLNQTPPAEPFYFNSKMQPMQPITFIEPTILPTNTSTVFPTPGPGMHNVTPSSVFFY
eukprot:NODE_215_length_2003_cov_248.722620_g171_i0.p1 GENE.NODE_215_length_2003_cov_248.722620_g171_i0~~NODE_215_length_2003_cov_248.722620_g171_i0.p1  ORF type:complete len:573 (+),score=103.65 NODE_215_length_2003_cov_248.722620_g171_i0:52-1770(+)